MQNFLAAVVQMNSDDNPQANLQQAKSYIQQAADQGVQWLVLPEMFACMAARLSEQLSLAEAFGRGRIQDFLSQQAAQHNLWLVGGTVPIQSERADLVYASCLLYNPQGECVARYDKIHLFDVHIEASQETYNESRVFCRGEQAVCSNTAVGQCALAVCYDVRFPEMFRKLMVMGAQLIAVPAAFTAATGKAHWDVLLRARAIENQVYLLAANQVGEHPGRRHTYGHSMIVSPWGEVLSSIDDHAGLACAKIDLPAQTQLRQRFPCLQHRFFNTAR